MGDCIPSCIGGDRLRRVWNQGHLVRFHFLNEQQEILAGVPFDIEFRCYLLGEFNNVRIANMSFIRPRMHCNSLGSKLFAKLCHLNNIGVVATACISEGGDFIYVYGEFGQVYFQHSDTKIRG